MAQSPNPADLWPLSYHLCGCILLGPTPEEPLGALPLPIRLAVLDIAAKQAPERFKCAFYPPIQLNFDGGQHATYRYWRKETHWQRRKRLQEAERRTHTAERQPRWQREHRLRQASRAGRWTGQEAVGDEA